jgi:hypothetical protein
VEHDLANAFRLLVLDREIDRDRIRTGRLEPIASSSARRATPCPLWTPTRHRPPAIEPFILSTVLMRLAPSTTWNRVLALAAPEPPQAFVHQHVRIPLPGDAFGASHELAAGLEHQDEVRAGRPRT